MTFLQEFFYGMAATVDTWTPILAVALVGIVLACFLWINSAWNEL